MGDEMSGSATRYSGVIPVVPTSWGVKPHAGHRVVVERLQSLADRPSCYTRAMRLSSSFSTARVAASRFECRPNTWVLIEGL
jgi:hypothetical protein